MMNTIQQQFLNLFRPDLHKDKLYNIFSGSLVNNSNCESLIMLESNAKNVTKDFEERLKIDSTKDTDLFGLSKRTNISVSNMQM